MALHIVPNRCLVQQASVFSVVCREELKPMLRHLALTRYCQRVKSCLPCRPRQRRSIVRQIRSRGSVWLAQNPSAPFAEFEQRFGTSSNQT